MWVYQLLGLAADSAGSKGLSFHMRQKFWTLAFVLALLKTRLDSFDGRMEGDGTRETQGWLLFPLEYIVPHHSLPRMGPWSAFFTIP